MQDDQMRAMALAHSIKMSLHHHIALRRSHYHNHGIELSSIQSRPRTNDLIHLVRYAFFESFCGPNIYVF